MSLDIDLLATPCPVCGHAENAYWNVTHNLTSMAAEAGIYELLWRAPDECVLAADLVPPIREAVATMEADPARFRAHNPSNGWGTYSGFLKVLKAMLATLERNPKALVKTCR